MSDFSGVKSVPVAWFDPKVLGLPVSRGKTAYHVAVCGHSRRVWTIGTVLEVLVIQSIMVDEPAGDCEEATRCLCVSCPLNKSTPESYAKAHAMKRWPKDHPFGIKINDNPVFQEEMDEYWEKHPRGGITTAVRRGKAR